MPHYRKYFDDNFIGAWDLDGKDYTLQIARVEGETLRSQGGRATKKPVLYFARTHKGLVLNKTNAKTIAGMYGTNTDQWIGKLITLYPTLTEMAGETVDAVRVRPTLPKTKARSLDGKPVDPEMREKQERAAAKSEAAEQSTSEEEEP